MSVAIQQPLDFAPVELRAHGLRDAHSFPLVGTRTAAGVRSWRMEASPRTWAWPLVEWTRTGNSFAALGFDCDSRDAVERAAACAMGAGDLPTPNAYATRPASGHVQVFWALACRCIVASKRGPNPSPTSAGWRSSTEPHSERTLDTRAF